MAVNAPNTSSPTEQQDRNTADLQIDVSKYHSPLTMGNKIARCLWGIVWITLFRPSPRLLFGWRRMLLQLFGAKLGRGVHIYPSCRIWAPWNLQMGDHSCLSHHVDCYSVDQIKIGAHATVSQYSYLCTASHDIEDPHMCLVTAPIVIENGAWICADVFVAPGVTVGQGGVAAARAVVTKSIEPWTVVGGNPASMIKRRELRQPPNADGTDPQTPS